MVFSALEDIEAAALQLNAAERAHLVERLLESMEDDDQILFAWIREAERRADEFDRGGITAIDALESVTRLRAKLSDPA